MKWGQLSGRKQVWVRVQFSDIATNCLLILTFIYLENRYVYKVDYTLSLLENNCDTGIRASSAHVTCVFPHRGLTPKACLLQRISFGVLIDVTVVFGMRQSIVSGGYDPFDVDNSLGLLYEDL